MMGPNLSNLVMDSAQRGEPLPRSALDRLAALAEQLGLPKNAELVLNLAEASAREELVGAYNR